MGKMRRRFRLVWVALYAAVVASGPMVATAADSGWTIQSLPTPALAPNGQLTGVSCATNTDCMAVGVAQNTAGHDITLTEFWDGARWAGQPTLPIDGAVGTSLAAVSCT